MKRFAIALVLSLSIQLAGEAASYPVGLSDIYNNIEPGQKYHPFWPPIVGSQALGVIVIADKPAKPKAFFESIESPRYWNSTYGPLESQSFDIQTGTYTQTKGIGVAIAFADLDAIAQGGKANPSSTQVLAKICPNDQTPKTSSSSTKATVAGSPVKQGSGGSSGAPQNSATGQSAPGNSGPASNDGSSSSNTSSSSTGSSDCQSSSLSNTGIDFSKFSSASVTIPKIHVLYYTLATLTGMADQTGSGALTKLGRDTLNKTGKGWITNRILVADSITYTLNANTDLDAGFFVKLVSWLPTLSVKYKNARTVDITTSSPVSIGYKLWRPGVGPQGASVSGTDDGGVSIPAEKIDDILLHGKAE
jgi:hypothetical protein